MKKPIIISGIIALIAGGCFGQAKLNTQNNMTNPIHVPLKAGRNANPAVRYETLSIEPVNLFIQSKPWHDRSPNVQAELNIALNAAVHNTFLSYSETPCHKVNYPKVFRHYLLGLNVNDSGAGTEVELTVEELTFGKVFYLETEAVIEDLTVEITGGGEKRSALPGVGDKWFYRVTLSQNNEQETFIFDGFYESEGKEQAFEWNGYKMVVLGTANSFHNNFVKMKIEKPETETGYEERLIDGGVEYRKGNVLYLFKDGALTTVEQLDWGKDEYGNPLSWDYVYSDTPKEIICTATGGDYEERYFKITLEKTVYHYKYPSGDGCHVKEYEAPTPLDIWIKLSELFSWDEFCGLKSGASEIAHDGSDEIITVVTRSGTSSVTNYRGNELKGFFEKISKYFWAVDEKAAEKVENKQ